MIKSKSPRGGALRDFIELARSEARLFLNKVSQ